MIRKYTRLDYEGVVDLLKLCDLPVPQANELEGYGLVAVEEEKLVGFVWALTNEGASVYIDHFCVHPDFRGKNEGLRVAEVAVRMMMILLGEMASLGKTRISGVLQNTKAGSSLQRCYNRVGMKFVDALTYCYGNTQEILNNLLELKNGKHGHTKKRNP